MGDKINEFTPKNFTFFTKPTYYDMSELKLEGLKKFAEIIQWGRRNPVKFCERFFGIEFLDYQKYVFMMSWITPNVVWCMSRNAGKTTLGSPFLMAKTMLLPKFEAYILSSTGSQSIGMMKKIESIAKKEIASFTGLTDVFLNELVKSANSEGFRHDPASYSFKLYSGSSLATVNSNFDGSRGRRSRLNFYDEASYVSEDMFAATLPFVTQNSDFALGGDVDVTLLPPNFPNQVICASSAGSMDDVFYKRYKEAAMHSMAGDKNYFCADIDCEVILHATYNGKIYPVPLLTQAKIDSEMKMNPTKATREYMNKFDSDLGDDIAVKKSQVLRNSVVRPPMLVNEDNSYMVICFDPAKKRDNSFVLIGKLHRDDRRGWLLDVVNGINLIDKETKKPLTTPEQIKMLQDIIVRYNGYGVPDYRNIHGIYIDAGSGGGATQMCDLLFDNFYESGHKGEKDYEHHGLIDANYDYAAPYVKRYPDAIDIIRMREAQDKVKRYFDNEDQFQSAENFLTDLQNVGLAIADGNNDFQWTENFNSSADAANKLGISVSAVEVLMHNLEAYGAEFNDMVWSGDELDQYKSALNGIKTIYDSMEEGATKDRYKKLIDGWDEELAGYENDLSTLTDHDVVVNIQFQYSLASIQQQIDELQNTADEGGDNQTWAELNASKKQYLKQAESANTSDVANLDAYKEAASYIDELKANLSNATDENTKNAIQRQISSVYDAMKYMNDAFIDSGKSWAEYYQSDQYKSDYKNFGDQLHANGVIDVDADTTKAKEKVDNLTEDTDNKSTTIDIDANIENAKTALENLKNDDGTLDLGDINTLQAYNALKDLLVEKQELEQPAVMTINTSKFSEESTETRRIGTSCSLTAEYWYGKTKNCRLYHGSAKTKRVL